MSASQTPDLHGNEAMALAEIENNLKENIATVFAAEKKAFIAGARYPMLPGNGRSKKDALDRETVLGFFENEHMNGLIRAMVTHQNLALPIHMSHVMGAILNNTDALGRAKLAPDQARVVVHAFISHMYAAYEKFALEREEQTHQKLENILQNSHNQAMDAIARAQ